MYSDVRNRIFEDYELETTLPQLYMNVKHKSIDST